MKSILKWLISLILCTILYSCASLQTSMTPTELFAILPTMTKSKLIKEEDIQSTGCTCITKNRSYTAPMGVTVKGDLKNGAKGIDEWVSLDKGNAYVIKNYRWITVGYNPQTYATATQLFIEFDTYYCK